MRRHSRSPHLFAAAVVAAILLPSRVSAGEQPARCDPRAPGDARFAGFHLYEENDTLHPAGGDERYTQGLRVSVSVNRKARPCWVQRAEHWWVPGRFEQKESALTLFLGQGLYTPRIITSTALEPNDRGFSNFNYAGLEVSVTTHTMDPLAPYERGANWIFRHGFEAAAGVLQHEGLARATQGGLHALKLSRMPKGWYSDGPMALGFYGHYRSDYLFRYLPESVWVPGFDIAAGPAIELGNVRTSIGGHGVIRVGWNLSGFAPGSIRPAAVRSDPPAFEISGHVGIEGRAVLHTALLRATPGSQGFERRNAVHDQQRGFTVRVYKLRASYVQVRRSPEFTVTTRTEAAQRFGSATLSYEPGLGSSTDAKWMPGRLQIELGMGRSFNGPTVTTGIPGSVSGQAALRVKTWRSLFLGVEVATVAVEGSRIPDEPANRDDILLRQTVTSVGWMRDVKVGTLGLRAGAAVGSTARIQTIRHPIVNGRLGEDKTNADYPVAKGGWIAGVQFFPHLERHVTVGVDLTYHRMGRVQGLPGLVKPSHLKAIVLLQLRTR
jgi:hypothetical protein